jgi:hypothetical protein
MPLYGIVRLQRGPGVDIFVRRREVETGEPGRHCATGEMFMDAAAHRRDAMEASDAH